MKISQLIKKDIVTCLPSTTVHDVANLMKDNNCGSVLVMDNTGYLKGIVTDRDIALNCIAESKDPLSTPVSEIMTTSPVSIQADQDIESALKLMSQNNIRRLPVADDGRIVGLVSASDMAGEIKEEMDELLALEQKIV